MIIQDINTGIFFVSPKNDSTITILEVVGKTTFNYQFKPGWSDPQVLKQGSRGGSYKWNGSSTWEMTNMKTYHVNEGVSLGVFADYVQEAHRKLMCDLIYMFTRRVSIQSKPTSAQKKLYKLIMSARPEFNVLTDFVAMKNQAITEFNSKEKKNLILNENEDGSVFVSFCYGTDSWVLSNVFPDWVTAWRHSYVNKYTLDVPVVKSPPVEELLSIFD